MRLINGSKKQSGFSMIEILVSILILAIGLLGVASLQTLSVKSSTNSNLRGMALYLANNMADRMRSNPAGANSGHYDSMEGKASYNCSSACNPAEIASNDKNEWDDLVTNGLPDGEADLSRAGEVYTLTLSWTDRVKQGESANDDSSLETSTLNFRFQY